MSNQQNEDLRGSWGIHLVILVVVVICAATGVSIFGLTGTLKLNADFKFDDYSTLFVNLFFITVIVERFIEVFNSIWRREGRLVLARALETADPGPKKIEAQKELDAYRARTQTLAMYTGYALGIIVGLAGVRILTVMFETSSLTGTQEILFHAMDVLLTAGLIGGGSKGINAVTDVFGKYLEATSQKVEARGKAGL
jgi:hypothetical protein